MRWGEVSAILFLFLLACAPAEPSEPVAPAEQPPAEQTTAPEPALPAEPAVIVEPAPAEEGIYEPPTEEPPSIAKFLELFRKEAKNYKFTYRSDTWVVEGTKAKAILFRVLENEYHAPFIDTIYFDLQKRTAYGVCEGHDQNIKRQCSMRELIGKKYAVPYVQFKIKLPEDWLIEYQNLYVTQSDTPHLVTDRETVHLKHSTLTKSADFYIDPLIGLPLAVIEDGAEYQYKNLVKNQFGPLERIEMP